MIVIHKYKLEMQLNILMDLVLFFQNYDYLGINNYSQRTTYDVRRTLSKASYACMHNIDCMIYLYLI